MPNFSHQSRVRLASCDTRIQAVMNEAIKVVDFTVLEGHRSNDRQRELYEAGKSKVGPGKSKHNHLPSRAVDIAPYPIDWNNKARFNHLAGVVLGIAHMLGISMRWGGDWDQDRDSEDESFYDGPHFELI